MKNASLSIQKSVYRFVIWLLLVAVVMMGLNVARVSEAAGLSVPTGVYTGPGTVTAHDNFSNWLGSPVTYTTDYVDYKGGWQKDFIDSKLWLTQPWGKWVSAASGRRLVLGLPMLENANYGQFDQGAAGAFDSYFQSLANDMVVNKLGNSIIRLGYEANCNTIGPWQATDNPSGYVKLFRHIVTVMRATPGSSFSFDWTLCNGYQSGHALTSFASFYPGDDVVDIMGMDIYDMKWMDTTSTNDQRWQYNVTRYMGMQDHINFAASHSKPVSFPEWGLYKPGDQFGGGGDDPYFIDQMANWINGHNTYYESYFNLNWGGGVLSDFPNGQAEYKARFGQVAPPADTTAPSVSVTSPSNGLTISNTTSVTASASDNVGVSKVDFYVDGVLKATDTSSAYSYGWDTKTVANGSHSLKAIASDAAGNKTTSASVSVNVSNTTATPASDASAPVVTITSPTNSSSVGSKFTIAASATDNLGVTKLEIWIDGYLKKTFSSSSFSTGYSIKQYGTHTITVKAYDAAGNIGQAGVVVVR
ncbi:MAG TPA: Ig-like domain-containing protein [Patescibacteria group bacterium]|nr:Ig-like domain-containing protein [Patescibacteria group bacterium]